MSNNDEKLITEVQKYSHLYDLSNKNKVMRENAWTFCTWSNITDTTSLPNIVPLIEERIVFEEEAGIIHEAGTVQEAGIFQEENSFNLPETFVLTPTTSRKPTPNSKKRKRAREDLIDTALMKIGGETDAEDLLLALKNVRQKQKMKRWNP
ncbi:hypothetical protein TNCV_2697331 [Trichonephila clavipes]|nr:hypothetical protein TNCV_2697331 [Trichonephila clavipes]